MDRLRIHLAAFVMVFVPPTITASSATEVSRYSTPFSSLPGSRVAVPVTFDATGVVSFLVDTGSTRSAVSTSLATRLSAPRAGQTLLLTPGGAASRPTVTLAGARLGQTTFAPLTATVLDDEALPGGVDGLLGQDALGTLTYTIDYPRRRFEVHSPEASVARGTRIPIRERGGLLFVDLRSGDREGAVLSLMLDSGSDGIVLFDRPARARLGGRTAEAGLARTAGGVRVGRRLELEQLDLGGLVLRDQTALLLGQAPAALGDGLLPLHLFSRVTVDARGRSLIVSSR